MTDKRFERKQTALARARARAEDARDAQASWEGYESEDYNNDEEGI